MTDLKPSTGGDARNPSAPSEPSSAKLRPATPRKPVQPTDRQTGPTKPSTPSSTSPAPIKPAQPAATHTGAATKPVQTNGAQVEAPTRSGQVTTPNAAAFIKPSPSRIQPATPAKPGQPRSTDAAGSTKLGPINTHTPAAFVKPNPARIQPGPPSKSAQPGAGQGTGSPQPSPANTRAPAAFVKPNPPKFQPAPPTKPAATSAAPSEADPAVKRPAPPTKATQPGAAAQPAAQTKPNAQATAQPTAPAKPTQTNGPQPAAPTRSDHTVKKPAPPTKATQPGSPQPAAQTKPNLQATAQPAAPAKSTQTNASQPAAPTKPDPVVKKKQAAATKPDPVVKKKSAPSTKPDQPDAAQTAVPTKSSPAGKQLTAPDKPDPAGAKPAATPAKRSRVLPIILGSVAATLVAVLAVAAIFVNRLESSLTQNLDREDMMPSDSSAAHHPTKEPAAADALNFVVMGYDSRNPSVTRSGSLMILHLNAERDQAYFISFPRDTWVSVPGHANNKINAAYSLGGPKLTVSTLETLTDTRMDHAVLVDFQGFAQLTDAVGGVTVYNRTAFTGSDGFHYPKGNITISGERAIHFVGERKALPRGDLDRAINERNVVIAIIAKALSPKIITDPKGLVSLVSGAAKHLTVDQGLTKSKIRSTVLALRLTDKDVHLVTAPVSGKATRRGQPVDVIDRAKLAELRAALREDKVDEYVAKYPEG